MREYLMTIPKQHADKGIQEQHRDQGTQTLWTISTKHQTTQHGTKKEWTRGVTVNTVARADSQYNNRHRHRYGAKTPAQERRTRGVILCPPTPHTHPRKKIHTQDRHSTTDPKIQDDKILTVGLQPFENTLDDIHQLGKVFHLRSAVREIEHLVFRNKVDNDREQTRLEHAHAQTTQ